MNWRLVFIIVTSFVLSTPAYPQAAGNPTTSARVGVINIQTAIVTSNEGRKALQDLDQKFAPKRTELKSLSDEIDGLKKRLNTQGSTLSDIAREDLATQIESKQRSLTREQQDAQSDFRDERDDIVRGVLTKLIPIVDKYAQEKGFALVIDASKPWPDGPVLWINPSIDITKGVVDTYNAQAGSAASASPAGNHRQVPESHSTGRSHK